MTGEKVWFITGCSSGIGREMAKQVLQKGDKAVITARHLSELEALKQSFPDNALLLNLDTTKPDQVKAAVEAAIKQFGRIDVLVNNAGYAVFGIIEDIPENEVRQLFETNFYGMLSVTKAILPFMRKQKSGHIINMSGIGGIVSTTCLGVYNASKHAIEGLSEALAQELEPLGIHVTIIEPGPSRTPLIQHSVKKFTGIADYEELRTTFTNILTQYEGNQPGDPEKIAETIIQIASHPVPPLRLPLGKFAYERIREKISGLTESMNTWEQIAADTDFKKNGDA